MRAIKYITFILFTLNCLLVVDAYQSHNKPVALTSDTLIPVINLFNSKLYLQENDYDRSREQLSSAIRSIYLLRDKLHHRPSVQLLDHTLPGLVELRQQFKDESLRLEDLNSAYVKTLLAMAHVQVQFAHSCSQNQGERDAIIISLRRAMYIVKKALILSDGSKKDHEVNIYAQMYDLVRGDHSMSHTEKILQEIIEEIKDLEITFDN